MHMAADDSLEPQRQFSFDLVVDLFPNLPLETGTILVGEGRSIQVKVHHWYSPLGQNYIQCISYNHDNYSTLPK